jgi:hypothetical protein
VKRLDEDLNRFEEEQLSGMKTFTYPQGMGPGGPRNTYDDAYQASPYNKGIDFLLYDYLGIIY